MKVSSFLYFGLLCRKYRQEKSYLGRVKPYKKAAIFVLLKKYLLLCIDNFIIGVFCLRLIANTFQ